MCIYPSKGSALAQVHPHNTYQTNKDYWLYEAKALDRNSRVSSRTFGYYKYTTGLSFAEERIGPLAAIIITVFYLLAFYLPAISKNPKNLSASIYSETLIKTANQHLVLLVGFDTLIYRKYYDTPPILVGHQDYFLAPLPGSVALLKSGFGKGNRRCEYCFYFVFYFYFTLLWRTLHLVSYLETLLLLLHMWRNHHRHHLLKLILLKYL